MSIVILVFYFITERIDHRDEVVICVISVTPDTTAEIGDRMHTAIGAINKCQAAPVGVGSTGDTPAAVVVYRQGVAVAVAYTPETIVPSIQIEAIVFTGLWHTPRTTVAVEYEGAGIRSKQGIVN